MVPSIEEYSQGSVPTGLSNFIVFLLGLMNSDLVLLGLS